MMRRSLITLVLAMLALLPLLASAQSCTVAAGTMDFGAIPVLPVPQTDVSPNLTITCTGGPANTTRNICVGITAGTGTGSTLANRQMNSGANTLQYQIYADAGHGIVWGTHLVAGADEQQLSISYNGAGAGNLSVPMYGRIPNPPAQTPVPATYNSTLTFVGRIPNGGSACSSGNGGTGSFTGGTFLATARIDVSCTISASPINFGSVGNLAGAVNGSGNIQAQCSSGAPYTIALNAGSTTGNTIAVRRMSLGGVGAGVIQYQLYHPPGFTSIWGDGSGGSTVTNGSGNGAVQNYPINAQVPVQATPSAGTYQDTVTATISY